VLLPLADIQPDLVHPLLSSTVKDILAGLSGSGVTAVGGAERVLPMGVCVNGETRQVMKVDGYLCNVSVRVAPCLWKDFPQMLFCHIQRVMPTRESH